MALSTALMLAPSAMKLGANLLHKGKPTDYEKELFSMADVFGKESKKPLTDTQEFRSGQSILNAQDRKNRKAINANSATTGATEEAKIANMQSSNESYNDAFQRLMSFASRMRDQNRGQYLNLLGAGENARQNRIAQTQNQWNSILDPMSQAGSAFKMAELFSEGG